MNRCLGRLAATPAQTFGDGQTQFFFEERCPQFALTAAATAATAAATATAATKQLCKGCMENLPNGRIDELIPETSQIFGPTTWFLDTLARCGAPSKEVFKKAVEAHKQVVETMAPTKKVIQPVSLSFIELDETIEIKEVRAVKLKPMKSIKKKQILKDEINGYLFEKLNDGTLTLVLDPSQAKPTTQERVAQEAH